MAHSRCFVKASAHWAESDLRSFLSYMNSVSQRLIFQAHKEVVV